jgi:hypothetical protein
MKSGFQVSAIRSPVILYRTPTPEAFFALPDTGHRIPDTRLTR